MKLAFIVILPPLECKLCKGRDFFLSDLFIPISHSPRTTKSKYSNIK